MVIFCFAWIYLIFWWLGKVLEWAAGADRDKDVSDCDEKTTALESDDFDFSKLPSDADQMV